MKHGKIVRKSGCKKQMLFLFETLSVFVFCFFYGHAELYTGYERSHIIHTVWHRYPPLVISSPLVLGLGGVK